MATARQLYDLHEIDQQIKTQENALKQKISQQRESDALLAARARLTSERQRLDDLKKRQRELEADIADLAGKIATVDDQLYGGRIRNPKELSNLQAESNALKARRDGHETEMLQILEQGEAASRDAAAAAQEFQKVEAQWQEEQGRLVTEIEQLQASLGNLHRSLEVVSCEIDAVSLDVYNRIKRAKGHAVARIEQGVCRSCRISLSSSEIQKARSGRLATCSSCGRILYLP